MKEINLRDSITQKDELVQRFEQTQHKGFRTKIEIENELGEVLFTENSLMLGGALFALEKLFGVQSPLQVSYLNDIMNIATSGPVVDEVYPKETVVCLFGVGTGGAGDSITSVYDLNIRDREIIDMIPFRVTDKPLTAADDGKYWFRKPLQSGKTAYYLKKFEVQPVIRTLWKDGEGDEDGSPVDADVHLSSRSDDIETFVELVLKINKSDCREWFEENGNIEHTRINSIGLFTGVLSPLDAGSAEVDYKQVKLFSKLNINNEMLTSAKELTVKYRIYTT